MMNNLPPGICLEEQKEDEIPQRPALCDAGLTLLVNTCKKTIATVGGDGYSEIVLYVDETTGEYWVHTYSKYVYMKEETHASYVANEALVQQAFDYIKTNDLESWVNNKCFGLCGGDFVIRFKTDNGYVRLSSGNMMDGMNAYYYLDNLLHSVVKDENRRYSD